MPRSATAAAAPRPPSTERIRANARHVYTLGYRRAEHAASATAAAYLGRRDPDVPDIATVAATRTIARLFPGPSVGQVLDGADVERLASRIARSLAADLLRRRHGRRGARTRRVDPLVRADTSPLSEVRPEPTVTDPETLLLAREARLHRNRVLAAVDHLPRRQREAVRDRLRGRRPLPAASRQALGDAVRSLSLLAVVTASGLSP